MQDIIYGALYIRVSTHGKQEELSPDAQKRLLPAAKEMQR